MPGSEKDYYKLLHIKVPRNIKLLLWPFRIFVGFALIVFGIIGIILPGLPGWTPLILGVMIISPKHGKSLASWVYGIYKKYIVKFLKYISNLWKK